MKTIGLIGGMSWESTIPYYKVINEYVGKELGGFHSAKILLYSVDFAELEENMSKGQWSRNAALLSEAAIRLEKAGADVILICTNTMHKLFFDVQDMVSVPLIHIALATADALDKDGIKKVALLGTRYTMTEDFYRERLKERGFEVLIPDEADMQIVHDVIFDELCHGIIKDDSRKEYARIIADLKEKGAEAVILGCTEIGLLIAPEDSVLPTYDTTIIHAESAARFALS